MVGVDAGHLPAIVESVQVRVVGNSEVLFFGSVAVAVTNSPQAGALSSTYVYSSDCRHCGSRRVREVNELPAFAER